MSEARRSPRRSRREIDVQAGPTGLRLRVSTWGEPSDRVTVLLHGFLEQGAAWHAVATRLQGRVLAPDHRGHGLSEHVGRGGFYHFWDYVADLDGLLDAMVGDRPVDLVGHSMGGTIASLFAASRPGRVRRLVLVEGLGPPDMSHARVAQARRSLEHRRSPPLHRGLASVAEGALRMRTFNPSLDETTALELATRTTRPAGLDDPDVDPAHPGPWVWTWDPLHRARAPRAFEAEAFGVFLDAIEAPTLAVDGGDSRFRPADLAARVARLRDVRTLTIPEAGHLIHHDQPAALAGAISAHLGAS
ncbi:MAG: pimeloyl-ACP methyl ester carboxylesterase [Myxococcota bacterium]